MKLTLKLIVGFIAVSLLVGFVGFLGLYANKQIVNNLESGERHFGPIVVASNEVSSYAKRAEGHLMLYITLHNETDKQKVNSRIESLRNQTSIIDEATTNPQAREILSDIISKTDELQSVAESLIYAHDNEMNETGKYDPENDKELILKLNKASSAIREDGVKLTELETRLKAEQEETAKKNAEFLYNVILAIGVVAVFVALIIGYFIAKNITNSVMKLKNFTDDIGRGKFDTKTEVKSKDEIGELSEAFDKMVQNLKRSQEDVRNYTKELEKSKKELESKINDLEQYKKLTVGRELKMVELKKKIEELEGKLKEKR
ncbi:MAG: HAMP domain-containing protein [Thermoplasmata archaeon]|nr:HAMP domain-containing protein [Thermoplasmata archaeon]